MKERRKEKKEILGVDIEIQWQVRVGTMRSLGTHFGHKSC